MRGAIAWPGPQSARGAPQRDLLRVMAFGVVLFTLLAQGTTIQPILERLKL